MLTSSRQFVRVGQPYNGILMWLLKEWSSSVHVDMQVSPKCMVAYNSKVQNCVHSMIQCAGKHIPHHLYCGQCEEYF